MNQRQPQYRSASVVILAGLMVGLFAVPVRAATVTVDFRQDLDPVRVSLGMDGNFQQAKTAVGLRLWTEGAGRSGTVGISLEGLTANNARLAGDFIATLTYSDMAGWKIPPYDNIKYVRLGTWWGAFGGEDYVVQRSFERNWVTDLYPHMGDRFECATWIPSNGVLNGNWTHYNGVDLEGAGTLTIQRIGNEVWLYANGGLLGHGAVDGSKTLNDFYIRFYQSCNSPIDITLNSFTLSGPNVVPWASALMMGGVVGANGFGFNLTGTSNLTVVVEACTNLSGSVWEPIQTNTLTSGSCFFNDSNYTNYSHRFYRVRMP